MTDVDAVRAQYHRGLEAFIQGDPEPVLRLWSQRDGREDDGWRIVHRHADPIPGGRRVESVAQS